MSRKTIEVAAGIKYGSGQCINNPKVPLPKPMGHVVAR